METTYIYGLYAEEGKIRYVGKTNNLEKRLYEHILNSKLKKTHKDIWIQKELKNGNEIKIVLLEEVNYENWQNSEIKWIEKYKNNNLTNHAKGGTGGRGEVYKISYEDLKSWIKNNLKCSSKEEWHSLSRDKKLPSFIPKNPYEKYKSKDWKGWGDLLGTNRIKDNTITINYVSYENAKKIIKANLNVSSGNLWKKLAKDNKIPKEIPNRPERYYKNKGWISWGDFLGTNRVANQKRTFISYEETISWLKENKLFFNSKKDWLSFCKKGKPIFIPSNPDKSYKNTGWTGFGNFFQKIKE